MEQKKYCVNEKGQATPTGIVKLFADSFADHGDVRIIWLGGGGAMINAHGEILMIDPVLEGFDMPLLIDAVCDPKDVKKVDAYLVSHVDNDHYSRDTVRDLKGVVKEFHASHYVASLMKEECGADGIGHTWHDHFITGNIEVAVTPADHNWQNDVPEFNYRVWEKEEYCGYYLHTYGKKIWYVGDSRLMEEQLHMDAPDVILYDFSDNECHIGFDNALKLAAAYPDAILIPIHWGTVDAPEMTPFNADPDRLLAHVLNPGRVCVLLPGEEYILN